MGIDINQTWVDTHKEVLLKILEQDFDPHLKRVDPSKLVFKKCESLNEKECILEFETLVLEYGGCSGVSHETPEIRRLKYFLSERPLEESLQALL